MASISDEIRLLDADLAAVQPAIQAWDQYYEGEQPLKYMAPAMAKEYGETIAQLVLNWPRVVADAHENRLDIEGFRYAGTESVIESIQAAWQGNNLDELSQQGHLEAIALGRSYICVGAGDSPDDLPVISIESPMQMTVRRDQRTRAVRSAWKTWVEDDDKGTRRGALYLPDSTHYLTFKDGGWVSDSDPDEHNMGRVSVVPLVNRPRILRPGGMSEFKDIIGIADAANKMATDMMVSGEHHAMPRRWLWGLTEKDFKNPDGSRKNVFSMMKSAIWSSEKKPGDIEAGQFNESDLRNFHETIKLLAAITLHLSGLPSDYMAFTSDNPSSADAIIASESRFIKRIERMQTYFSGSWEEAMRLVLFHINGVFDPQANFIETMWRNPATPTLSSKADAIIKLASGANPIMPKEMAREELGWSPEKRKLARRYELEQARQMAMVLSDGFANSPADDLDGE